MNVFFNTNIQNSDCLAAFGNIGLAPVRYFFNGKTIRIEDKNNSEKIHSVVSFEKQQYNFKTHSKTDKTLKALPKNFYATMLMIVSLIPGLIFGTIAKAFSYLSKDVRENHKIVKEFLKPYNITIGSEDKKLNYGDVEKKLLEFYNKRTDRKLNALIVHGNNIEFNSEPLFYCLNPKKIIFVGCKIVHKPCGHILGRIDDKLHNSGKWLSSPFCVYSKINGKVSKQTLVTQMQMSSVKDALNHVRPKKTSLGKERSKKNWFERKKYHVVYLVNSN